MASLKGSCVGDEMFQLAFGQAVPAPFGGNQEGGCGGPPGTRAAGWSGRGERDWPQGKDEGSGGLGGDMRGRLNRFGYGS